MTSHRDFKAIIRARMAVTGLSYTSTRVQILQDRKRLFGITESSGSVTLRPRHSSADGRHSNGTPRFNVAYDPRCEFMAIMGRLAGYFECNGKRQSPYTADVDAHFSAFKRHPAVQTLQWLKQNRGFDVWYLPQFGVGLTDIATLDEMLPFEAPNWDPTAIWTVEESRDFRAKLRDFAVETNLHGFLARHAELYAEAARRLRATIDTAKIGKWLQRFYHASGSLKCFLVPALLMPSHRAPAINEFPDDRIELFGILGAYDDPDERGIPSYSPKLEFSIVEVFCRLRIRAEVSIHEASLRVGSEETFAVTEPEVAAALRRNVDSHAPANSKYELWHSMMSGALSIAIFSQYLRGNGGEAAVRKFLRRYQTETLVFWREPLFELFEEFANDRKRYPRLGDFMPRVAEFFVACAAKTRQPDFHERRRQALQSATSRAPLIVRRVPPHGATDVDPGLSELTVEFDRRMSVDWGFLALPDGRYPRMVEPPSFDETTTVLTIPVSLEPDTNYALLLNSHHYLGLADADGKPLIPTLYSFKTGPHAPAGNSATAR